MFARFYPIDFWRKEYGDKPLPADHEFWFQFATQYAAFTVKFIADVQNGKPRPDVYWEPTRKEAEVGIKRIPQSSKRTASPSAAPDGKAHHDCLWAGNQMTREILPPADRDVPLGHADIQSTMRYLKPLEGDALRNQIESVFA
jgi:hypothetical protein